MTDGQYESLFAGPQPMDELLVARLEAAQALAELSHCFIASDATLDQLQQIALLARRGVDALSSAPRRERSFSFAQREAIVRYRAEGPAADVEPQDLFPDSVVSGSGNPMSMGLRLSRDGDVAVGDVTLGPAFQGAPGRAHGGVTAALVDETLGGLLPILNLMAFTGELKLRYLAPCPLGVALQFRAWLVDSEGRKLMIKATGKGPDGTFVEADAVFITVSPSDLEDA